MHSTNTKTQNKQTTPNNNLQPQKHPHPLKPPPHNHPKYQKQTHNTLPQNHQLQLHNIKPQTKHQPTIKQNQKAHNFKSPTLNQNNPNLPTPLHQITNKPNTQHNQPTHQATHNQHPTTNTNKLINQTIPINAQKLPIPQPLQQHHNIKKKTTHQTQPTNLPYTKTPHQHPITKIHIHQQQPT